jgi:hypothetical protein
MRQCPILRPALDQYPPLFREEIEQVPDRPDFPAMLEAQLTDTSDILAEIGEANGDLRYAPEKWSVREVIGHLIDCERVLSYRALRFSRGDLTPLSGFDQRAYVPAGAFDKRMLEDLMSELRAVRLSTVALVRGLDPDSFARWAPLGKERFPLPRSFISLPAMKSITRSFSAYTTFLS